MASKARSDWDNRIECVMDLCTSLDYDVLSPSFIRSAYATVGTVLVASADSGKQLILLPSLNVYAWSTKKNRHYYCEFASAREVEAARSIPVMKGVVTSVAKHDPQHIRRFKELADPSNRYSPYELRSTRPVASPPTRADMPGPSSSKSKRGLFATDEPRDDLGQAPEEGEIVMSDTVARPTITIPILGEAVRLPLNDVATPSAVSALLSVSASARPFPQIPSPPQILPSSVSYSQTAQEMVSQLSDLHQSTLSAPGAERVVVSTISKPTVAHTNGTGENHITSIPNISFFSAAKISPGGRFLKPEAKANGLDAKSFEPTPLQAYFADIYGSLQSDLQASKRRIRQQDFELERMKLLCQQREHELAEERAARRDAEASTVKLSRQHDEQLQEIERCNAQLDTSRGEIERLKGAISQIRAVCDVSLDPMPPRPFSSTRPTS